MTQFSTRRRSALGLACAAALICASVQAAPSQPEKKVLRLGQFKATIVTAAWSQTVAHDRVLRDALARLGYVLQIKNYASGPAMAAAFAAREIDAGPQTEIAMFQTVMQADATVVGMLGLSYVAVVARTAVEPRGLVDARVATIPGTVGELALTNMLDAAHMQANQVKRVELAVADMQAALENGKVDAVSVWEPTPQRIVRANPGYRVLFRYGTPATLIVRNEFLRDQSQVAAELVAAYLRAYRWWGMHDRNLVKTVEWVLSDADRKADADQARLALLEGVRTLRASVVGVLGLPQLPLGWTMDNGEARQRFDFLQLHGGGKPEWQWSDVRQRLDRTLMQSIYTQSGRYRLGEFRYE
jgi:ABC-type nitrate/sulfonate/bicarbonate transport system substrate-binding protein